MLQDDIKVILEIQEYDVQMIRLVRLKRDREEELQRICALRDDLHHQVLLKESSVMEMKKQARFLEAEIKDLQEKVEKLESQQNAVRKVEEFNALTHEISALEREKAVKEQRLSDVHEGLTQEEDLLENLKSTHQSTAENGKQLETEIIESIKEINTEGVQLKEKRDELQTQANTEIIPIYEKLLKNRRNRVVVPLGENRCCGGCHIQTTAQHENLVRKGEKLVFCEHCSRILFWPGHFMEVGEQKEARPRRRRRAVKK